jgi:ribonuclease HI
MWAPPKADGLAAAAVYAAVARISRATDAAAGRTAAGTVLVTLAAVPPSTIPPEPAATSSAPTDRYVLFFDGGSRGNPGPGEVGAVIVRTDLSATTSTIVWSAAMSLAAPTTTNNQAEYTGLLTGLRAVSAHAWTALEVVGDSMLILRQISRSDRRATFVYDGYTTTRLLSDRWGVTRWVHHLRAWNKMADAAANVAMDTRRSLQTLHPTSRPEWQELPILLAGDFHHWRSFM